MGEITNASDSEIRENVDAFRAAIHAREPTLPPFEIRRILLAVDDARPGSSR